MSKWKFADGWVAVTLDGVSHINVWPYDHAHGPLLVCLLNALPELGNALLREQFGRIEAGGCAAEGTQQ